MFGFKKKRIVRVLKMNYVWGSITDEACSSVAHSGRMANVCKALHLSVAAFFLLLIYFSITICAVRRWDGRKLSVLYALQNNVLGNHSHKSANTLTSELIGYVKCIFFFFL